MSLQLSSIALAGFHGHCWNHRYPLRTQFELTIGSLTLILIRSLATYTSLMLYKTDLAPSTGSWASTNDGKTKEDRKEEKKSQLRSRTVSSSFRLLRLSRRRKPMPFQKRDSRCLAASSYRAAPRAATTTFAPKLLSSFLCQAENGPFFATTPYDLICCTIYMVFIRNVTISNMFIILGGAAV